MRLSDPLVLFALAAALPGLAGLWLAWSCRRRALLSRLRRGFASAVCLLAASLISLLGLSLLGYARLLADAPVAEITVQQLGPQRFVVEVSATQGRAQRFELSGDEWQLDARVLRWQLPAALAGAPPLYRLERLSGRYRDTRQELEAQRSVHALAQPGALDLWTLRQQFPQWLPFVDADFGSGAYLPMLDGAHYRVSLSPRGGLVAQAADEETRLRLREAGW
ncbi:MAG: hypothetical protein MEQ07_09745 [Aquimonas sp.]|nr:hypothetical protein [Aquimonas sp.]